MADVSGVVDRLRLALQQQQQHGATTSSGSSKFECLPWSWLCQNLIALLRNYPGGLTDAAILTSLHSEVRYWCSWSTCVWPYRVDWLLQWKSSYLEWKRGVRTSKGLLRVFFLSSFIRMSDGWRLTSKSFLPWKWYSMQRLFLSTVALKSLLVWVFFIVFISI